MKLSLALYLTLVNLDSPTDAQTNELLCSYTKTRCMGTCPAFSFVLYTNGRAIYNGKEFVERIGRWTAELTDDEMDEIKSIFEKYDFFSFKDRYYKEISDLPTIYIEFNSDNREKKVMDYYDAPQELKQLEQSVEAIIERLNWVRISNN